MSVLMFINIKGGVAKTTNAIAVARCLAERGKRVLVIDSDHQCAASELLLGQYGLDRAEQAGTTLHNLLSEVVKDKFFPATFADYVVRVADKLGRNQDGSLSVMPCSLRLDDYHLNYFRAREEYDDKREFLKIRDARLKKFRRWLLQQFDYTIIDCPPSMPLPVQMLVLTADSYIVPCIPERLSMRGAQYLLERMRRKKYKKIRGLGTLWSLVRVQNKFHVEHVNESRKKSLFPGMPQPFTVAIPNSTDIVRAFESTEQVINAKFPRDISDRFNDLVNEIVERCAAVPVKA